MFDIPALSVTRPWSTFLMDGVKLVENRTWTTRHRGLMWLHAAQSWQGSAVDFAWQLGVEDVSWEKADYPVGVVGLVELVDICNAHMRVPTAGCECGLWAAIGQFHWKIRVVQRLTEPVPCRGSLGLWQPTAETLAAITAQGVTV